MAIIAHQPHAASLIAAGPVRVLAIDQRSFEEILRERPETCLALLRHLCQRIQPEVGNPAASPLAAAILA
jgi:CRP-like cAMP-binding protein